MYLALEVVFLGLGVARVVEWVKELCAIIGTKRWPGRTSKMLMSLFLSGLALIVATFPGESWQLDVICFLGIVGVATTAHAVWAALQATKDVYRLNITERLVHNTGRRR
jgi:hypothetical protein